MLAARWVGGFEVRVEEVPTPSIGPEEVLVQVKAAGICATDLHMMGGAAQFAPSPLTLGHEFGGVVAEVGSEVANFAPGDRVTVFPFVGCGVCTHCRAKRRQYCPKGGELGSSMDGGGWAEYACAPAVNLYRVPKQVSDEEAGIIEPLSCTLDATEKCGILPGDKVFITGDGPAGLLFLQLAKYSRAEQVVLLGSRPERMELAKAFGADVVLNRHEQSPTDWVRENTQGYGMDVVIEGVGTEESLGQCLGSVRQGGRLILYGGGERRVNLASLDLLLKDVRVFSTIGAEHVWPAAIKLVEAGAVKLAPMITHRFPLEEVEEAIATVRDRTRRAIKVLLVL